MVVWRAANGICSKRLVPFLPELVPILERRGHLTLDDADRLEHELLGVKPRPKKRRLVARRRGGA